MPRVKTSDVADTETERCSFADLSLPAPLLRSLAEMGCEHPSPVQMRTIPAALTGVDVIVQAKSGTGKTIAFCSVVLQGIDAARAVTQALILTPTREITMQVADEIRRLSWYFVPAFSVACFIGGVPIEEDEARISQETPHIAVGTPGRTLKLLQEALLETDLRYIVLDEADKLLDSNFRYDVTLITELAWSNSLQFLALSATFPPPLIRQAELLFIHVEKKNAKQNEPILRELPKNVFLCTSAIKKGSDGLALQRGEGEALPADETDQSAVLKGVLHFRCKVEGYHVRQKLPALLEILTTAAYQQAFVFCNGTDSAVQIAEMLTQAGIPAAASSGRMEQSWRTQVFAGLKRFQYRVLVCTDLMSRGVDVDKVDVVVNLGLPAEKETYLHRSGRTARFGSIGWSISVVFDGEEDEHLSYFQMQLGFDLADYSDREQVVAAHLVDLALPSDSTPALAAPPTIPAGQLAVQAFPQALSFATEARSVQPALDTGSTPAKALSGCISFQSLDDVELKSVVRVLDDADAVLRACRAVGIGTENDEQRLACVGKPGKVLRIDPNDGTIKVSVPSVGKCWFSWHALAPMQSAAAVTVRTEEQRRIPDGATLGGCNTSPASSRPERIVLQQEGQEQAAFAQAPAKKKTTMPDVSFPPGRSEGMQSAASMPVMANMATGALSGGQTQTLPQSHPMQNFSAPECSTMNAFGGGFANGVPHHSLPPQSSFIGGNDVIASSAANDLVKAQLAQQQLFAQQQQQLLAQQQQQQQQMSAFSQGGCSSRALPPQACAMGALTHPQVPASLRHLLPPPVFFPPPLIRGAEPPLEIRALVPEWEPWMLGCSNFNAYSSRSPGLAGAAVFPVSSGNPFARPDSAQDRMNALWANHCRIWTSVQ